MKNAMTALDELKSVSDRYFAAWPARDAATIADLEAGRGFGHSTAFPRETEAQGIRQQRLERFFSMMDSYDVRIINRDFFIDGGTGLEWGHYAQTSKQKDGPLRTVYLRFTHTYTKSPEGWKLALYHRSKIPSEDIP